MPLYDFRCSQHGRFEDLVPASQDSLPCPKCSQPSRKMISMPARTSGRWGDCSGSGGVNGYYDKALGASYSNSMERDAIMKAKNLIHLEDLGGDSFMDSHFEKEKARNAATDSYLDNYDKIMKETSDPILSMQKARETSNTTIDQ
jgi:putative FmdB family regulatory protein